MEDEECAKMFVHLQQYVPHLEKLIAQLKDPKKENRELQLNKLEGLYSMITDKKKKLKLDTLRKCEDVILKILQKVNPNIVRQLKPFDPLIELPMIQLGNLKEEIKVEPLHDEKYFDSLKFQAARARLSVISTPASPSPPKESIPLVHLPIVIPTEKLKSPPDPHLFSIDNWIIPLTRKETIFAPVDSPNYKTEKPDIYNKAAATLNSSPKGMVFDRLGAKVDMSKPPLSEEDLQQLTTPHREVYYEDQKLEDLEDLRQKLQKKLLKAETKLHLPDLRTKLLNKDKSPSVTRDEPSLNKEVSQSPNQEKSPLLNKERSQFINKENPLFINKENPQLLNKENQQLLTKEILQLVIKEKSQLLSAEKSPPPQIKPNESEVTISKSNKDADPRKHRDKSCEKSSSNKVDDPKPKPNEEKHKKDDRSSSSKPKSAKVEKVIKDANTQFGSLLSSIDEKILGDKKKDGGKRDTSVKSDKAKGDKKDSTRRDSHSHEKKEKSSRKSEDVSKRRDHHKSKSKDRSKNSPRRHSKDRETDRHKSSHRESNSRHSNKSREKTTSNEKSSSSIKASENSNAKSHNDDSKDIQTFKRLADKYNPRPRKNSVEDILRSPVGDARTIVHPLADPTSSTNVLRNPPRNAPLLKDPRDPRSANQRPIDPRNATHAVGDPRSIGHGHPVGDPRAAGHSAGDIRNNLIQISDPRSGAQNFPGNYNANKKFYEPQNIDAYNFNKPQNPMEHQNAIIQHNTIPVIGNVHHRTLLPTPSHPMQMGFQSNNTMIRQNEFIQQNNQFIPPQQQRMAANQSTLHQSNSFANIYYKANSNQMTNPGNIPYQGPSKAFHPYEPIESTSSSEYDLSKMQPVDFYSPAAIQPTNQLTSPPTYGNRTFASQGSRVERSRDEAIRTARDPTSRVQHDPRSDPRKEETSKLVPNRDPRIRSREMKERSNNVAVPPKATPVQSKPTTGEPHKHDSGYSKTDRKTSETFISPLDSLYSTNELAKTITSKGYGIQNFKIPKKKANRKIKERQVDLKEDSHKHDKISDTKALSSDDDVYEVDPVIKKPEEEKPAASNETEVTTEPSCSDPKLITEFVAQMIQSSDKQKLLSTLLDSLEGTIYDDQKKEALQRIKKAINCDAGNTEGGSNRAEIDTPNDDKDVSSTTEEPPKVIEEEPKTSKVDLVSSDLGNDDVEDKNEDVVDDEESFEESDDEDKIKPKKIIKRLINTRSAKKMKKNKKRGSKKVEDLNSSFEENVVETVSERTKSKRRIVKTVEGKPRKCRTELDMLHEDIKEMFIRDGVLTANGKRMCTMLKGDKSDSEVAPIKDKHLSKVAESEETPSDSPKRRARESNPKVLIEKTDLTKHASQSLDESESESEDGHIPQRRTRSSLKNNKLPKRNTRSKTNYKEDTSDDENKVDQKTTPAVEESKESKVSEEFNVSEDESKASEDETKATEDVPVDESENAASGTIKRNKRKRRGYNWAAGIIHKHKRPKKKATSRPVTPHLEEEQPPSETENVDVCEDESPEIEYSEPDKNYYFDPQMKPDCKLCSFKGRMIIQHYRSNHPKNEVLISRLSPTIAETAINESKAKNFNEFEVPAECAQPKFRRNKYTFQCRFCQVFLKNETTDTFFDHVTSHTGEYRFVCNFCPFRTANSKSVRSHMHSSHNATSEQTGSITPTYPSPPDFGTLFGYICSECNFIQMNRVTMERHSKIIHTGNFSNIYKISMSMIPSKNPTVDENLEQSKDKEIEEPVVPMQEIPVDEIAPLVIEEKAPEEVKLSENDESLNAIVADKQKPEEVRTAFTITDSQEGEIEKFEETKQQKMEEIQKTIYVKKNFASNLLEKLKNRLNDKVVDVAVNKDVKDVEAKEKPEVKIVEEQPKTPASVAEPVEFISSPSTSKSEQITLSKEIPVENDLNKKGLFDKRENTLGISNIIERLQDKLADSNNKLPPLIPIEEFNAQDVDFKPEEITAQVGPFMLGKKRNTYYFVCYIKSCMFSSSNPADLKTHCTTLHLTQPWDGYCISCDKMTTFTTALGAYSHLIDIHTPKEISAKAKLVKEEPEIAKPYLRMRRLSGDILSEKLEMLNPQVTVKKEDPDIEIIDDLPPEEEEPFNFPFQIANVTSLANEEAEEDKKWESSDAPSPDNNVSNPLPSLAIISSAACFGTSTTTLSSSSITFPLQLQTSNGPAIGIVLPILSSIKGSSPVPAAAKPASPQLVVSPRTPLFTVTSPQKVQSKKILLKDTPLQLDEILKPRKTKTAMQHLLSEGKLKHLYKCPERFCYYSTDIKKHFEMHLKQHVEYNSGIQIPCLYCNFKTNFNLIGIHYDIRHSKCLFCCAYCFYRAVNQSYVEIHQESEHIHKARRVIVVPQNQDALMSQANIAIPHIRSVLTPYTCGQLGCEEKFLFETDFKRHLVTVHQGIPLLCVCCPHSPPNEEAAVVHAQEHNVHYYNCRYCLFGANDIDDIDKHLSQIHFALPPQVIIRQYQDKGTGKASSEFKYQDDTIFDHLVIQSNENMSYITAAAKIYSKPSTYTSPTNVIKLSGKETITLYKAPAPNPGVPIKFLTCTKTSLLKDAEVKKPTNSDVEIVQVSDDDDEQPVLPKAPIVLNSLIAQGKGILSLDNIKVANETPEPETIPNFINIQPEMINSDDCVIVPEESDKTVLTDEDPLKLDSDPLLVGEIESNQEKMDIDVEEMDISLDECNSTETVTRKQGLSGILLFRCGNCKFGFKSSIAFRTHITLCVGNSNTSKNAKPFKCYHCPKTCKSSNILMDHLRLHGTPRFSCSLCDFKHQHQTYVRSHMKVRHKVTSVSINPIIPHLNNYDEDCFIMKPKFIGRSVSKDSVASNVLQDFSNNSTMRVTFGPDQIDKLPIRPIFSENIVCARCGYESKVRANLVRHLQFHLQDKEVPVPASAPVNPVPCLDKNEKMFDKMTNLAHSSFSDKSRMSGPLKRETSFISKEEEANYPRFVPSAKRYVCGAHNCQYLNQEESILRNHVQTFHSDETTYKCLHCNESLAIDNQVINVENILHHLKLHDLNLYKCKYCTFLHYQKQKVEVHVTEKHLNDRVHIVVVREMEQEPQDIPQVEEVKEKKPWRCGICKYRCTTKSEIVSHAFNKHEVENQYNCAMCNFKSNERDTFESHFRVNHLGHRIDVNSTYYEVMDTPQAVKPVETEIFDTTPLWQRDKNKFKHIRGIPLDETIKVPKKSPFKVAPMLDNLDKSIEAVANGSATAVPKSSKSAVIKKPKTLKEKRMKEDSARAELFDDNNDLSIVIDDASEELPFSVTERCYDDPVTIIYNGTETSKELTIKDIEEMDLNVIKHGEFSCITGKFGKPANKEYFCPICENFKTKRVIEFTQHLYKDLEYDRFVCTRCGLSNTSSKVLERHSIKKHPNAALSILPLAADTRIEDYVNKLLAYQQRVMFAASQPEIVERKLEPNVYGEFKNPEKCKHCSYSSKYCGDLKKHETRHWAVKPYKCGICAFEGVTSSEVIQHSRRVHANRTPDVITVQLPENPVIVPISRKRRYTTKVDSDVSSDAFEFTDNSSDAPLLDNSDGMDHENDAMMYVCHYCPKRGTNESEIKDHWEIIHKPKSMIFKVKKVKRSDLVKPSNVVTYKCGYCDFKAQFDNIKKHCKELHPEMTFSAFRFKCGVKECKEYLKSYDHVKTHFKASHPNVKVSYIDVSKVTTVAAPKINCEFCSLKFDSRDKFTLHQKEMHSHLLSNFPTPEVPLQSPTGVEVNQYKCPECNHISCNYAAMRDHVRSHAKPFICSYCMQRFLYPSVVKTHHNREHRDLEFKYECDDVAIKRNDYLRSNILILSKDGTYVKNKTSKILKRNLPTSTEVNNSEAAELAPPPVKKFKATARKSTTKQNIMNNTTAVEEEGYSYYGCKPDLAGIGNIKASLPFLDTTVKISLSDLTFINIFPVVVVEDIQKTLKF